MYGIAQFKLDRPRVQQGHDMTRFLFHTHARLVTSKLPCKALVYTLDVCMIHMCMSGTHMPNLDYPCMRIVSQKQQNTLYKHVDVTTLVIHS